MHDTYVILAIIRRKVKAFLIIFYKTCFKIWKSMIELQYAKVQ